MKKIQITKGYASIKEFRDDGTPFFNVKSENDRPFWTSNDQAERLIRLKVAKLIEESPLENEKEDGNPSKEEIKLDEMTVSELKEYASELDAKFGSRIKKDELIELIKKTEAENQSKESNEEYEETVEEGPTLSAADPE